LASPLEQTAVTPIHILMEESDPVLRAHAHISLGEGALDRSDEENAQRHFKEALELAPDDDLVRSTTGSARLRKVMNGRRSWASWWN
jgi:Flp pilus assembly protein TadD